MSIYTYTHRIRIYIRIYIYMYIYSPFLWLRTPPLNSAITSCTGPPLAIELHRPPQACPLRFFRLSLC